MKKNNMKTITTAMALMLMLLLPFGASAQISEGGLFNTDFYNYQNEHEHGPSRALFVAINSGTGAGITNDDFGSPLGSGIAILLAAGAGYAVVRRKRSRRNTTLLLACLVLLGFTQCKKEQIEPQGGKVNITLNVENGASTGSATDGARANVDPPHVSFVSGDRILVAYDGKYVGYLEHNGTNFSGNIDATGDNTKPLYFYFLGNCVDVSGLTAGTTTSCTANISDQTGYPAMPVISFSASDQNFNGAGSYTASLHNKASLMKFSVTTPSNSPICITGMNNKVIIDFSEAANDGANNGFTYDKDGDGIIKLKGGSGSPAEKWAIVLPQAALAEGEAGTSYTNGYSGMRPAIPAITADQYLSSGIAMTVNTVANILDLSTVTEDYTINNGWTVIGALANEVKISIADGATVTLDNASINAAGTWTTGDYAGITCLGNATIILSGTNTVKGFYEDYPGIFVPSSKTLIIQGTGSLTASSNCYGAGIGGGYGIACGNIEIQGGTINATGGFGAAGIGAGANSTCGSISITNGTVVAHAGDYAAGIGAAFANGNYSTCSGVSISGGSVTAYGGLGAAGIGSALSFTGSESYSQCGDISITGGTVVATGGNSTDIYHPFLHDNFHAYGGAGIGTGATADNYSYQSNCGNITIGAGVTSVTATKGDEAQNSIGKNHSSTKGTCGTVTIEDGANVTQN